MPAQQLDLRSNRDILLEAKIAISSATTTAIIAAAPGFRFRVYKMFFLCGAAQTIDIQDGSTSLTAPMTFATGGGGIWPLDQTHWFVGSAGSALNFVTTTSGTVSGRIYYTLNLAPNASPPDRST